ncbi:hypothetical protein [Poseidonibacter lekithochrous]|uniref:hypothetical protein n=1 Tax=Poseidonibacter lekithochrous TaxID=1904463 RepID=UPI0008FCA5AC|nr:hypothetical protein [Poseidonibacter lekithochrous]QKJ21475.1 hypothetical protein ALEK_0155 [Poseidonibacter lekithochrous]
MKRFLNTIIGLSLLIGSASFAQDNLSALYPAENDDTPSYVKDFELNEKNTNEYTLAKNSISNNTLKALYGQDSWEYTKSGSVSNSVINSSKSTLSASLIKELYQES